MDWGLLNALGITVMAFFGLWAFQKAYAKMKVNGTRPEDKNKDNGK